MPPHSGPCAPITGVSPKCRTFYGITHCYTFGSDNEGTIELLEATDEMWGNMGQDIHVFYKDYCVEAIGQTMNNTDKAYWSKVEAYAKSKKITLHDGKCDPHVWDVNRNVYEKLHMYWHVWSKK